MKRIVHSWRDGDQAHVIEMVHVQGAAGHAFLFGEGAAKREIEVRSFYIATVPVTQALWTHIMEDHRSNRRGDRMSVENVSWDGITGANGFLARINAGNILPQIVAQVPEYAKATFRLPSETEWEYAARGGPHWPDDFKFSGSHDIDAVAWYNDNSADQTHDVAQKAPNQLGIHDMCGNVWEWCQDTFTSDVKQIPADGTPFAGARSRRVLRGGCFHNWAIHCTVSKRYEIGRKYHDGCIGFRLVLSEPLTFPSVS
jgi:sulfatase modifying factor 1